MKLAPIVLFVYNRPWHTRQTVEALLRNDLAAQSELVVYSDAPKNSGSTEAVGKVRSYLTTVHGFKSLSVIEREVNLGLARSIITGVSEVVNHRGRVIVVEDDLVTSPYFLRFMNSTLDLYERQERVISIHGYVYPVRGVLPETFFIKGADCWGWATWKRGWDLFERDGRKLAEELRANRLERRFNFNGSYPYSRLLEEQIAGHNDSWAVRWYASALLQDKVTLYPGRSLVHNIGNDDSGTHCDNARCYDTELSRQPILVENLSPVEDAQALRMFEAYFRRSRPPLLRRLLQRVVTGVRHGE